MLVEEIYLTAQGNASNSTTSRIVGYVPSAMRSTGNGPKGNSTARNCVIYQ